MSVWLTGRPLRVLLVSAAALLTAACTRSETPSTSESLPTLERITSSARIAPSQRESLVLLSSARVCLVDSYRTRVLCGDRNWEDTTVIEAEGEGPGDYREGDYLGSVSVRDRVVAYDILGSTLAVLVERQEPDAVGLYPRHVDWYRITEAS